MYENERGRIPQYDDGRPSGAHATRRNEPVLSRSADPGQSSYGGFSNQDPSFQRQQLDDYTHDWGTMRSPREEWGQRPHNRSGMKRISPKGYQRSDERLREAICEQLTYSGLDVSDVSVAVSEGKVMLEGTVGNRYVKHEIENYADDCPGVQDVDNRIRVPRQGGVSNAAISEERTSTQGNTQHQSQGDT